MEPDTTPPTPAGARYLLLLESDLNRVYSQSLGPVAAAEFAGVAGPLLAPDEQPTELTVTTMGRAVGLSFRSAADPGRITALAAALSSSSILFEQTGDHDGLVPRPLDEALTYETDLVSVQRYRGKTNERLTRAMVNLGLAAAGIDLTSRPLRNPAGVTPTVLDPMCGRGTTLNWALCYGLNAVGIEPDAPSLRHYDGFLKTWAKQHRLPHKHQAYRSNNAEHRHMTLEVAPTRADQKAGAVQRVETFNADGGDRSLPIKKGSIDAIVSDLPYGIQHRSDSGGRSGGRAGALDPADTVELVARVAPTWRRWLRKGGAVCLAWNVKRASRVDLSVALAEAGLMERLPETDDAFTLEHVVDATITRDVIVAVAD